VIGRDDPASSLHWWLGLGDPSGLATFVCIATDGSGYSGGADVLVGTSDLRDGLWHHVVVIREAGGTSRLYVDTGLEAEKTVVYTAGFEGSTPLTVGWFNLSGNYEMQGIIDELAVYGRALELTEIEQHYSNGLVGMGYCEESSYPLITSVPVTSGTVGMPYSYNVEATGNPVPTFALTISPEGMEIDPASGVISWLAYATGDFDVTVEASNTWGVDQQNYTISCSHLTEPVISTISDVGNDEGGQVRLIWHRSDFDAADDGVDITSYGIYRRQDQFKSAVGVTKGEHLRLDGWDYIETIPARGDDIYQYVAPTLCDSTIMDGMCWSVFFISAMTPDPLVFYDSLPDSGYSVDNLAPPAPSNIVVAYDQAGNVLNWDASEAADFHSYLIYRDWSADFEPGPDNLVTMLRETSWFDDAAGMPGDPLAAFYMIAAQDSAGNVGEVSAPEHTTSVDDLVPTRYALHNNVPNPFNPLTSIKYDLPRASHVSLCIFDVSGRLVRVIVDGEMQQPGRHEAVWNGRDNAGRGVAAGLYFYRLTADTFTDTRRMLLVK